MRTRVHTYITQGTSVQPVTIEVDIRPGLPAFTIIAGDTAGAREIRDRVRAAILNSGYEFPARRITVVIAPDVPSIKPELDLALACAVLAASDQTPSGLLDSHVLFGELALDGHVRSCPGALAVAEAAAAGGLRGLILPPGRAREAAIVSQLQIIAAKHLSRVVDVLAGGQGDALPWRVASEDPPAYFDLSDIRGQQQAIEALILAAAGGHHLLLSGPPSSGRSMLARRLPGILPPLNHTEAIDVTRTYSLADQLGEGNELVRARPFRAPHHTISAVGLLGGGRRGLIGEITLADHGVLYLDELTELARPILEALRQPLNDRFVTITRGQHSTVHPARFIFVGGSAPCRCGYLGDDERCRCSEIDLRRYQQRLNSPLLDHISLVAHLKRPDTKTLTLASARSSAETRELVILARERQHARLQKEGIALNAEMSLTILRRYGAYSRECWQLTSEAQQRGALSTRGVHHLLCVARTAADLDGSESVHSQHLSLALSATSLSPPANA
jgi:magnesium chelatase family protein